MSDSLWIERVRNLVDKEGLTFFGVVPAGLEPDAPRFEKWLSEKRHAGMAYLEQHTDVRRDSRNLLANGQSIVVVGINYFAGDRHEAARIAKVDVKPRIAQYARYADYHKILWAKGGRIIEQLKAELGADGFDGRVVVDSAPVLERALASRTGVGFIGKNTCFIHPKEGSYFLLAEIVTTLPVPSAHSSLPSIDSTKRTAAGGCGSCKRCQVHCPTGALDVDFQIDAGKCLSYWTIENRGTIPEVYWPWLQYYWFGCDICQLVCPYNREAKPQASMESYRRPVEKLDLFEVATMNEENYVAWFGGTPMTRAKRDGLRRNALIALFVTKNPRCGEAIRMIRSESQSAHDMLLATVSQIESHKEFAL